MKKLLFIFFTLYCLQSLNSQNSEIIFQVLDDTKKPIPYVTVLLKNLNRGTHSDTYGFFKIPPKYFENAAITISAIGFETKEFKIATFKKNEINIVFLKPYIDKLNEIKIVSSKRRKKVKKLNAREIIKNAIEKILINYPTKPHSIVGYYRDYQQPVNNQYQKTKKLAVNPDYINLNEAIIEDFDQGFQTKKLINQKNKTLLYQYKTNTNFPTDSVLKIPYDNNFNKFSTSVNITPFGGNELNILHITNAIRNHDTNSFSFINVFNQDFLKAHRFKLEGIKNRDGIDLFEISFNNIQKKTSNFHKASGKIYISKYDFSIYRLSYDLFYKNSSKPQYSVAIEYLPKGTKMYLSYMMFNNMFTVKSPDYLKLTEAHFDYNDNVFKIFFNKPLAENTLESIKKNIDIFFDNKKIKNLNAEFFDKFHKTIVLKINTKQLNKAGVLDKKVNKIDFTKRVRFKVKNIKSKDGLIVNQPPEFKLYQFREFFVQKIFEEKKLPITDLFIDENSPLFKSKITPFQLDGNYWLNSPLKKAKTN